MRVILAIISAILFLWESQELNHKAYKKIKKEALTKVFDGLPDLLPSTRRMTGQKCDFRAWKCKKLSN